MFKFVMTKNRKEIFQRAVIFNDIKRTRLFLEEALKDPRFNIDDVNDEGLTPLQYSTFAGNLEMMEILVNFGASWRIRDREGYTLLHAASMAGHPAVVRYLLKLGIKPVVKTDEKLMPIDLTEDLSIIVILLRSMLDQGYLREMQDYMLDHPKLKRNIFEELEKAKTIESKRNEVLGDLPYTSRRKQRPNKTERPKSRSLSSFYALSDSIQNLHSTYKMVDSDDNNNEFFGKQHEDKYDSSNGDHALDAYQSTQQYLESRYPVPQQSKTVTFDLQVGYEGNNKAEPHISQDYHDKPKSRLSYSSSISTHSSSNSDVFSHNTNPILKKQNRFENHAQKNIPFIDHPHDLPPGLPPRVPINYNSDRQLGSETDSGIDLDETAGRVFALSIDDKPEFSTFKNDTYSGPLGLYYNSKNNMPFVRLQKTYDDNYRRTFYTEESNDDTVKYQSWNGTSLEARQLEGHLRYSFCRKTSDTVFEEGATTRADNTRDYSTLRPKQNHDHSESANNMFSHQPDIML